MVELRRGIKAGIAAGFVYGIIYAFFITIFFYIVASLLGIPTTPPPLGGSYVALRVNPFMGIIIGPIFGIILGLIYAFMYNRLPGKKLGNWSISGTKGVVLTLLIWFIMFLIAVPTRLSTSLFFSELGAERALQIIMSATALWAFVIGLGRSLGYFWDRFRPRVSVKAMRAPKKTKARPEAPQKIGRVKIAVIAVVVIVAVGVCSYFLLKGGEGEGKAYELSYNFRTGESYVYDMTYRLEYLGMSMELSSSETLDVLKVLDNEFDILDSATVRITITGQAPQTATVVATFRMTNKGVRSGLEIENVEPPELWTSMEQTLGQWGSYLESIYHYPIEPVPIGRRWSIPIDFQFQQAGMSMTLAGECRSSIAGRENITVRAGTFDCWRLAHNLSASGEAVIMGQTVTMAMSGEATSWINPQSGAQTKVNLPLNIKVKVAGQEIEFPINMTMELIEYQAS